MKVFKRGAWYYTVSVATAGTFAWVPFAHAAIKLEHSAEVRRRAIQYGAASLALFVLAGVTPTDASDEPAGTLGNLLSTVTGIAAIAVIAMACVQLRPLRRAVYGMPAPALTAPGVDPVVAEALATRKRRDDARALATRDPGLARDLRVGRPDLPRQYDDGGLVDLNGAPAEVFVRVCGTEPATAERLIAIRMQYATGFTSVDEVLAFVDMSEVEAGALRDRAIVLGT